MKILLVCNYFQPQFAYAESEVGKALKRLGHTVEIITSDRYFPFPNYQTTVKKVLGDRIIGASQKKEAGIQVTRKKVYFELFARSCFFGIFTKIKNFKPDIVLSFGLTTPSNIQVSVCKYFFNFKFIGVDSHLPSELFSSNKTLKKVFYFLFRIFFSKYIESKIDKIVSTQEGTTLVIEKYYGLHKNISLVSHGTDATLFKFNKKFREETRKKYSLKSTDFLIIYTGKVIESKGVHILTQSLSELLKKYKNIFLLIVGSGPEEYNKKCLKTLSSLAQKNTIWEEIKKHRDLPKYYNAADLAIWPLQESLSMNDAAACELPFIANDKIGVKERISNENALLYKTGNAKDLAKKLNCYTSTHKREKRWVKMADNLLMKNYHGKK